MLNPRRVLPHSLIYDRVWGYDFGPASNALRVYVGYLRRKLEDAGARPLIHTVRGVGYVAARAVSFATPHRRGRRRWRSPWPCARRAVVVYVGVALGAARAGRPARCASTRERVRPAPASTPSAGPAPGGAGGGPPRAARSRRRRALRRRRGLRAVRLRRTAGHAARRRGRRAARSTPRARRSPRARRRARLLATRPSTGTHLRVLTIGDRRRRRGAGRAPADRGRQRARPAAADPRRSSARPGSRSPRCSALRRRPHRARADRALHAPHRGADRRPRPVRSGIDVDGRRRARPAGPQLQHDARRARALGRGPAPPGRRRQPRAAHADRQPAREHPAARGRRPPAAPTSATACARDIIAELDELTALVADVVELARGTKPRASADDVRLDDIVADAVAARAGGAPPT